MNVTDNLKLLRDYADHGDETAFRELVKRYVDLVYSAAFRRVGGDAGLAQDVAQTVFTDLARKAKSLRNVELLGGWLHRHTGFVASNMVRSEQRRQVREQEAAQMNAIHDSPDSIWQQLAPVLDDTIEFLDPEDRQAVLLRFFERYDFRHIGNALGISDDAAQKRVSRALEKLRTLLTARGVTLSVVLLSTLLAGRVIVAAPAGLAGSAAGIALSGAAGGGLGLMLFNLTKSLSFKVAGVVTAAAVAWWLFGEHNSISTTGASGQSNSITASAGATNVLLTNDQPPAAALASQANSTNATGKFLLLTIVAADSGQPVPDVKLDYIPSVNGSYKHERTLEANRFGICKVPVPDNASELLLVSEREGFADTLLDWRPDHGEQIPTQYTLQLARAVAIGGRVVDPDGKPVEGAEIGFNNMPDPASQTRPQTDNFGWPFWITAKTDAQGHWKINRIGKEALPTIYGSATHPEFVGTSLIYPGRNPQTETQFFNGTYVFALGHAVTVRGIVKDPNGQPVANAHVLVGQFNFGGSRNGKSRNDGTFSIVGCEPGSNTITAQVKGFAPAIVNANLTDSSGTFELVLQPGKLVKMRVTDESGSPVTHAEVMLDTFQNGPINAHDKKPAPPQVNFSERTDATGRLEWDGAPDQELAFDIFATGYMTTRSVKLQPDGVEHVITLQSALTISGTVSDAATGQPIPRFRILTGWPEYNPIDGTTNISWSTIDRFWLSFDGGKFQYVYGEPVMGGVKDPEYMFKFMADGYAPFIAGPVKASERSARFDVALTPASPIEVIVLSPNGNPAVGTDIGLTSPGARLALIPGGFSRVNLQSGGSLLQTDNHGQFALSPDPTIAKVIAAGPDGYAEATMTELTTNPVMNLLPWGRLEGTYLSNGQPQAGRRLSIEYGAGGSLDTMSCDSSAFDIKTDDEGRFVFDRVPPGNHEVTLVVPFKDDMGHSGWSEEVLQKVTIVSGETTTITIGSSNQTDQANSNSTN